VRFSPDAPIQIGDVAAATAADAAGVVRLEMTAFERESVVVSRPR